MPKIKLNSSVFSLFLLVLVFCIDSAAIASSADGKNWLQKMSQSLKQLNYDGTFIYSSGVNINTMRVIHALKDGVEHERLVPLDGPRNELVRQGDEIICVASVSENNPMPCPLGSFAEAFNWDLNSLDNYQIKVVGSDNVVRHNAVLLDIKPLDKYRYGYRLWLDKATGFILKAVCMDDSNKILEHFQFTELKLAQPIDEKDLQISIQDYKVLQQSNKHSKKIMQKNNHWEVNWLPQGFIFSGSNSKNQSTETVLMYSDGLSGFSIFIKPFKGKSNKNHAKQKGATTVVMKSLEKANNKYLITVVGEIPMITAKKVAASVQPSGN